MTAFWGVSRYLHSFLISTLLSGDRSPSELGHFVHGGGTPVPIWAAGSIWKLWKPENLSSCWELNCDCTVVQPAIQSPCSDWVCPCSQMWITDMVDTTNLSRWAFRQSTVRANTQYRWVWTECQIDMRGTQTASTRREVDEHGDCPRYSVRTRDRQYEFHSQPEITQNLKPIGTAEPVVNTNLTSKGLRTQLQRHVKLIKFHYKVKVFNSALRNNRSLSLVPHDIAGGPTGRAV